MKNPVDRQPITFYLPGNQKKFLQAYADQRCISMTQVIRELIDKLEESQSA